MGTSRVGRPSIFKQKVNKATGLTQEQDEWLKEMAGKIGMSKMALLRCAVTLFMQRNKASVTKMMKLEKQDVLDRLQSS